MNKHPANLKKAAILGHPVAHSLSPRLHSYWLQQYAINGRYDALDVHPEELSEMLSGLSKNGFAGVNLTIPHKEAALLLMDEIDETARRIGAVNTVVVKNNGELFGINTDAYGFIQNLHAHKKELSPYLKKAIVLGAGGAARAVCVALIDAGVQELWLVNRTQEKAEQLQADLGKPIKIGAWKERESLLSGATMLVNTTSLGMKNMPALELSLDALPQKALVTDIVYSPLKTPLLEQAEARGNLAVDGLGMLLYQAHPAFDMWFGKRPEVTESLRQHVLKGM